MDQVFGAVTPFTIMMVITLLTQFVKSNFTLSNRQVQFVALGFSLVLIGAYQVLVQLFVKQIPINPFDIFAALIFSLLGWFTAIGMYEVAAKQLARQ